MRKHRQDYPALSAGDWHAGAGASLALETDGTAPLIAIVTRRAFGGQLSVHSLIKER
jgi:hypothetical protein